jgi:hypothetical protein
MLSCKTTSQRKMSFFICCTSNRSALCCEQSLFPWCSCLVYCNNDWIRGPETVPSSIKLRNRGIKVWQNRCEGGERSIWNHSQDLGVQEARLPSLSTCIQRSTLLCLLPEGFSELHNPPYSSASCLHLPQFSALCYSSLWHHGPPRSWAGWMKSASCLVQA